MCFLTAEVLLLVLVGPFVLLLSCETHLWSFAELNVFASESICSWGQMSHYSEVRVWHSEKTAAAADVVQAAAGRLSSILSTVFCFFREGGRCLSGCRGLSLCLLCQEWAAWFHTSSRRPLGRRICTNKQSKKASTRWWTRARWHARKNLKFPKKRKKEKRCLTTGHMLFIAGGFNA